MDSTASEPDDEVERLRSMAAKLRSEAAALAAEQSQQVAKATQKVFSKFDQDNDGLISAEELKVGLEKTLKMEISDERVAQLLETFDTSGDMTLQPEEFVGVDRLRNQLDTIAREEMAAAREQVKKEEALKFAEAQMEAQMEIFNEGAPTNTEKVLSVLPYLFPLVDSLQYAGPLVAANSDNPIAQAIVLLFTVYRSIPFAGFVAFFALSTLSSNPTINRQIRFNMQQAVNLDIFLFFPGLLASLYALLASNTNLGLQQLIPPGVAELGGSAVFLSMVAAITYASVSSLAGVTPDKIPFISQSAKDRTLSSSSMMMMFDEEGKFIGENNKDEKEKDNKKD